MEQGQEQGGLAVEGPHDDQRDEPAVALALERPEGAEEDQHVERVGGLHEVEEEAQRQDSREHEQTEERPRRPDPARQVTMEDEQARRGEDEPHQHVGHGEGHAEDHEAVGDEVAEQTVLVRVGPLAGHDVEVPVDLLPVVRQVDELVVQEPGRRREHGAKG